MSSIDLIFYILYKPPSSLAWPYLRLVCHLNVQQKHMLPYSTLYVAIVTLQRSNGVHIQQNFHEICEPCSNWDTFFLQLSLKCPFNPLLHKISAEKHKRVHNVVFTHRVYRNGSQQVRVWVFEEAWQQWNQPPSHSTIYRNEACAGLAVHWY